MWGRLNLVNQTSNLVIQVSASISASVQNILIMRHDCDLKRDTRPLTRLNISISVEDQGRRETGSAGGG